MSDKPTTLAETTDAAMGKHFWREDQFSGGMSDDIWDEVRHDLAQAVTDFALSPERVEAAAKAIRRRTYPLDPWEELEPGVQAVWLDDAEAALRAGLGVE